MQKPYQEIRIVDCGEPLIPIPLDEFAVVSPHPYVAVGAPYGDKSPFFLRTGIVERLRQAQERLQILQPGWHLQIFDAYRPVEVQQYMVNYSFAQECTARGRVATELSDSEAEAIWQSVYQFWAVPHRDPTMPPPHSTGAAIDVTLVNELGRPIDMGSAIDELSERSFPQHFAAAIDNKGQTAHQMRLLLFSVMEWAGFLGHPKEWWHFSFGDQLWAWQMTTARMTLVEQQNQEEAIHAQYGFTE